MGPPASALCPLPPASAFKTSIGRASAPGGERRRSAQATENPPPLYSTLCLQLVLPCSCSRARAPVLVPPCSCPPALYHAMIWGVRYLRGWRSVAECNKTLEVYASLRFVSEKESSTAASSRAGSRSASIVLKKTPSNLKGLRIFYRMCPDCPAHLLHCPARTPNFPAHIPNFLAHTPNYLALTPNCPARTPPCPHT